MSGILLKWLLWKGTIGIECTVASSCSIPRRVFKNMVYMIYYEVSTIFTLEYIHIHINQQVYGGTIEIFNHLIKSWI